jgi:nucleosome-remodeling factor subunit BPTF
MGPCRHCEFLFFPGQQLVRLADGRLQLITLPTNQAQQTIRLQTPAAAVQTTPSVTRPQTTTHISSIATTPVAVPAVAIPKPTIQVVSAGQISQVSPAPVRTTTMPTVPAAQPKLLTVTTVPRVTNQLTAQQGPQVITAAQAAPQVATTRTVSIMSQQPTSLLTPTPQITATKLLTSIPQVQAASSAQTVTQTRTPAVLVSPVRPTTTVVSLGSPAPNIPTVTTTVSPTQSILTSLGVVSPTSLPPTAQNVPMKSIITTSVPANVGVATVASGQPRYAVTPQVVQQGMLCL